jgi:homoserine dehydrogenase
MPKTLTLPEPRDTTAGRHALRTVRVGLAGCGTVGGALLHLLRERGPAIEKEHGLRFQIVGILVRDPQRPRPIPPMDGLFTNEPDSFLAADADLVVEALGGLDPAARIARHTLDTGRAFVTANKALIAVHGQELARLARRRHAPLAFEAAVAGGVPVVRVLREAVSPTEVRGIRGILNGTANYILTRMSDGASFDSALRDAQAAGFAEADPTRDLDGRDAADKIAILAWLAFGISPDRLRVDRAGLLPEPDRTVADAAALGGVARLVAECARLPQGVTASVEPAIVPPDSALARAAAEENLVGIDTGTSGTISLSGPGAGGRPTASAILADMLRSPKPPASSPPEALESVPDPRRRRWAISLRGTRRVASTVDRVLEGTGIEVARVDGRDPGTQRLVTAPATRARARRLARELERVGLRPVVTRYDVAF